MKIEMYGEDLTMPPPVTRSPMFAAVKVMNEAFGNPEGCIPYLSASNLQERGVAWAMLYAEHKNIQSEVDELEEAIVEGHLDKVRDALCDVMIFTLGAFHKLGIDADLDMAEVVAAVESRFCRDQEELEASVAHWSAKGITVSVEGEFPRVILRSPFDQPDAPKGKFLKSVGTRQPRFYKVSAK